MIAQVEATPTAAADDQVKTTTTAMAVLDVLEVVTTTTATGALAETLGLLA